MTRLFAIAAAAFLTANQATAQSALPEYTIKITPAQAGIIGTALGDRPYREVAALITILQSQINEQEMAAERAAKKAAPATPSPETPKAQ